MSAQEALDTLLPGTPERERDRRPSERSDVSGERRGSLDVARDSILAIERAAQAEPEPEPEPEEPEEDDEDDGDDDDDDCENAPLSFLYYLLTNLCVV